MNSAEEKVHAYREREDHRNARNQQRGRTGNTQLNASTDGRNEKRNRACFACSMQSGVGGRESENPDPGKHRDDPARNHEGRCQRTHESLMGARLAGS